MTEKERYATIGTWVEVLRTEGHTIGARSISNRLKLAGVLGITGRGAHSRCILINGFYAESDVRKLLSDFLRLPLADDDGFIRLNSKVYGTLESLSRLIGVSPLTIARRLTRGVVPIQGRDSSGQVQTFYLESDIRVLIKEHLANLPCADADGLLRLDGKIYGTAQSLSRHLGISAESLKKVITPQVLSVRGKDSVGHIVIFYEEDSVRELCRELLEDIPRGGKDGFIRLDGNLYGTFRKLSEYFSIPRKAIKRCIDSNVPSVRGKLRRGQIQTFYLASAICERCRDYLEALPQADSDDVIRVDGEIFATINGLSRRHRISSEIIKSRITSEVAFLKGKVSAGQIYTFYCESQVLPLCQEYLENLPKADADGFVRTEKGVYGTVHSISRLYGLGHSTVKKRCALGVSSVQGKDTSGRVRTYYSESRMRELCADLIAKRQKING